MKIILLGIKNNGTLHIGHLLSIINPAIKFLKKNNKYILLILIADLHTITNFDKVTYNKDKNKKNIFKIISIILSLNIDRNKILFYRQSKIKNILNIFWFLNNLYKVNRLKLTHKYKSSSNINIGEFIYPILMTADIISLNTKYIFIGIDQKQHLEIANILIKKINIKLNNNYNFYIPKFFINKKYNKIIGINGKKMSKSYKNTITPFTFKIRIKKKILKIPTSNKSLQNINIKNNYLYILYKYLFKKNINIFLNKCKNIKYNFFKIKKIIYKKILKKYNNKRKKYFYYMNNIKILNNILLKNEIIVNKIINKNFNIIKNIFI
ncbi:MAG: tryptophan--tRNA ligase [Candidatus Shikimatogenerans sp. Tduv]|uniref:tryptophan--tRNA ligase n=1 Tax=Candidatus Shikimatogenerans sp. Tduv TaxID=3158567 RepID=A0AAU7QTF9_9FLAO